MRGIWQSMLLKEDFRGVTIVSSEVADDWKVGGVFISHARIFRAEKGRARFNAGAESHYT